MFGLQESQGRRQANRFTEVLIALVASLVFSTGGAAMALDTEIAKLAEQAGRHSEKIRALEQNQLGSLGTQVTVFLTLGVGVGLELDTVELFVDARPMAAGILSPHEQSGLQDGRHHQLYAGHLANGPHELKAVVTARSADRDFVRREAVYRFSKQSGPRAVQLKLTAVAPDFAPRVSFAEVDWTGEVLRNNAEAAEGAVDQQTLAGRREERQRAEYELAEKHRRADEFQKAGEVLGAMPEGYWAAAGYINLASDFAREDIDPSRALVALRVAMAMARSGEDKERGRHLQDQALLRAGYLAYQNGEYEKAIRFLESVSLESHSTPRALYFHGLALAERGNHRAAMQSWHRARKFPLAFPGVAEAWIAMGRGYDLAGYLGQAGEAFLAANSAYESERVVLRTLKDQVRQEGAYRALVVSVNTSDLEWFLADSRSLQQPRLAYLLDFLLQAPGQHAIGRVATLTAIERRLRDHAHDLGVFARALRSSADPAPKAPSGMVDRLLKTNSGYLDRLADLREKAEYELDQQVLAYLEHQDQRMAFALDRTEQQIAHLYEYLALESLGESGS